MVALLRAAVDRSTGYVQLRFGYDPATIAVLKDSPGSRWDPQAKAWNVPIDAWNILKRRFKHDEVGTKIPAPASVPTQIAAKLHPYQITAADHLLGNGGALLTMQMRTGKTPATIGALAGAFSSRRINAALITYPAGVREVWQAQLKDWAGLDLVCLEGHGNFTDAEIAAIIANPYLVVGCHFEILKEREEDLHKILAGRVYAMIADEIHACKNRKAGRTKALKRLGSAWGQVLIEEAETAVGGGFCIHRWGLTGTPMRNRNRDLFSLFDWAIPNSMGGYWTFAKAFCDAHQDDHGHWDDSGESRSTELQERLAAISFKVTRAEVASFLPKSDRKVIACSMPQPLLRKYRSLEKAFAVTIKKGLADQDNAGSQKALEQLAQATVEAKIPTALDRAYEHAARGVKVLCFATFHETLKNLDERFDNYVQAEIDVHGASTLPPHFCAGGWKTPTKRSELIEQWRACPGPAILLVNTLSSGVGIDLADAEVAIFLELAWVPADFRQAEDRIQDMHKGKRVTPPIYEYLITKDTIDEAMAGKLLEKVRNIDAVVGSDVETSGVAAALRGAGVVGPARLGLSDKSDETIMAAIASIRDRWFDDSADVDASPQEKLAAAAADLDDDAEESSDEDAEAA